MTPQRTPSSTCSNYWAWRLVFAAGLPPWRGPQVVNRHEPPPPRRHVADQTLNWACSQQARVASAPRRPSQCWPGPRLGHSSALLEPAEKRQRGEALVYEPVRGACATAVMGPATTPWDRPAGSGGARAATCTRRAPQRGRQQLRVDARGSSGATASHPAAAAARSECEGNRREWLQMLRLLPGKKAAAAPHAPEAAAPRRQASWPRALQPADSRPAAALSTAATASPR